MDRIDLILHSQGTSEEKERLILNTLENFDHDVMTSFDDLPKGMLYGR